MEIAGDVLVVMAKFPRAGHVKTRLGLHIGTEAACELYAAFLLDIAARFDDVSRKLVWAVDPAGSDFAPVVGANCLCIDQRGEGLAERMHACFETLFEAGAERVVMMGSDVPHLPTETVDAAFRALNDCEVSLVPSSDGGYCLIGLRRLVDLFTPIEMSTAKVFAQTRSLLDARGLRAQILVPSFDIDEPEDLRRLAKLIESGEVELPHTGAALAQRGYGTNEKIGG
jgi:rSAM/selenodomain-associated transferase 1